MTVTDVRKDHDALTMTLTAPANSKRPPERVSQL